MVFPPEVQIAVVKAVSFVVTGIIAAVADFFKVDLGEYAAAIIDLAVTVVLAFLTGLIGQLPANLQALVVAVLAAALGLIAQYATRQRHRATLRSANLGSFAK